MALGSCIVLHMKCYLPEPGTKIVKFNFLPTNFVDLLKTVPRFKHWRVITCREVARCGDRIWKVVCSCGYGQRHLMVCLHCSFVVQKVTLQEKFGCDLGNIHIRHTNMYASLKDTTKVERTHCDWKGLHFAATEEAIFIAFALPLEDNDEEWEDDAEPSNIGHGHGHGTRELARKQQVVTEDLLKQKDRISTMRSQMWEILNLLETTAYKEFVDTHAPAVEAALLDIRSKLPAFPQRVLTTVARRPAGQQKRRGRGGGGGKAKRAAATGSRRDVGGARTSIRTAAAAVSHSDISDSHMHYNEYTREFEYMRSGGSCNGSNDGADSSDSNDPVSRGARALAIERADSGARRAPTFLDGAWHIGGV